MTSERVFFMASSLPSQVWRTKVQTLRITTVTTCSLLKIKRGRPEIPSNLKAQPACRCCCALLLRSAQPRS
jgi:hypothetical protein